MTKITDTYPSRQSEKWLWSVWHNYLYNQSTPCHGSSSDAKLSPWTNSFAHVLRTCKWNIIFKTIGRQAEFADFLLQRNCPVWCRRNLNVNAGSMADAHMSFHPDENVELCMKRLRGGWTTIYEAVPGEDNGYIICLFSSWQKDVSLLSYLFA